VIDVALIFVADILDTDILLTFICDVFFVDTFSVWTFKSGIELLTTRFTVSKVFVVMEAGEKIVVVKLLIVPLVAEMLEHDMFPDVMVVSKPIFADERA